MRERQFMCALCPPCVRMRVPTHSESEIQGGSRDERKHDIYEEQKKQVFVGLYVGSTRLETQSEPAGVPVLTALVGLRGSRLTGKVGFRYQDGGDSRVYGDPKLRPWTAGSG